jgi:hypothetical protein
MLMPDLVAMGPPDGEITAASVEKLPAFWLDVARIYRFTKRRRLILIITKKLGCSEREARHRLRKYEKRQEFRDAVWQEAVVKTDLSTPDIMEGITKRATKGDVQAARLALEVTGRHSKDDRIQVPVQVVIGLGLPRPDRKEVTVTEGIVLAEEEDE